MNIEKQLKIFTQDQLMLAAKVPRITNDLDRVLATLRFRKLKLEETLMLVEEISQLRKELKEADAIVAELLPEKSNELAVQEERND
jgi:DNA-directed RNA polymerase subunit F